MKRGNKNIFNMIAFLSLSFHMMSMTMCYQRLSGNTNHNNVDQKQTHLPAGHYPHNHRWNEPYFDTTMPKNITSLVGKSAYLGCRVKHLGNKTVAWIRHRDLHILTVGTYTYTTDQRFQTSYHRDIDEWTLQIKWAQQRDAGVYECQISTQPVRSFSVNLNIVVPTATILGGPDLYVDRGSTINLTCVIKFSPEPPTHIFWYHQDKVLSEESSSGRLKFKTHKSEETKSILLIDDADLLDSGKYSCYPSNTEIASVRVHVLQGERPEAMQTNAVDAVKLQTSHHFIVMTTIVAAFVLLHILAVFTQRVDNLRAQNILLNGANDSMQYNNAMGKRKIYNLSKANNSPSPSINTSNCSSRIFCCSKQSVKVVKVIEVSQEEEEEEGEGEEEAKVEMEVTEAVAEDETKNLCNINSMKESSSYKATMLTVVLPATEMNQLLQVLPRRRRCRKRNFLINFLYSKYNRNGQQLSELKGQNIEMATNKFPGNSKDNFDANGDYIRKDKLRMR